jgi:hypothetical protein
MLIVIIIILITIIIILLMILVFILFFLLLWYLRYPIHCHLQVGPIPNIMESNIPHGVLVRLRNSWGGNFESNLVSVFESLVGGRFY